MAELAISRLALRAPAGSTAAARLRAEEALRLGAGGDERLLIIRRLAIRGLRVAAGARGWNRHVGGLIADCRRTAPHAGVPGAADAPAVWFHSRAEAAALLLTHLAALGWPSAWFWRLAVPDWQGAPLASWLPRALVRAETDPPLLAALARAMILAIEGGSPLLLDALARCPPPAVLCADRDADVGEALLAPIRRHIAASPRLAALLGGGARATAAPSLHRWIALALLLRHRPGILATPSLLAGAIDTLVARPAPSPPAAVAPAAVPANIPVRTVSAERASEFAGVLLLVRSLVRLGLAEWLEARPERLARGFGQALLRHVATRHRADQRDPALALLAEGDSDWADDLRAWRVGLDRWLRRTARLRLHDVVRRRGHVLAAHDRVLVRFPVAAADVRLRRHALDIDPGWTPWLGLVVLYVYRDEPLK